MGFPLGKILVKYAVDGMPTNPGGEELELNPVFSHWMNSQDRITNQMGVENVEDKDEKWGMILPRVIIMGTVTRRAIEKTRLTASERKRTASGRN